MDGRTDHAYPVVAGWKCPLVPLGCEGIGDRPECVVATAIPLIVVAVVGGVVVVAAVAGVVVVAMALGESQCDRVDSHGVSSVIQYQTRNHLYHPHHL